jgi:spore germination protein YaaH
VKSLLLLILLPALVFPQSEFELKGIHQLESEIHSHDTVKEMGRPLKATPFLPKRSHLAVPSRMVYGWHPYWVSTSAYLIYDYTALSHIAYFSYETDTATGSYKTTRSWSTTPIIAYAHQRGVKVTLTATNFGYDENDKILGDTLKQNRMISTLISLLQSAGGDGVNFDFETIRSTQRSNLVSFMRRAAIRIRSQLPNAEISMATPAVDWSGTWDFAQLAQICDYLIVMGYDYYWSGSTTAGPVAPLVGENYNISRTIDTYLAVGVPSQKLLLGVPWYGLDWPVQNNTRKAPATGTASSVLYNVAEPKALVNGKSFNQTTKVPWFSYLNGSAWHQVWYDDSLSLALKYALVNSRALGGIGIWALSYDAGKSEIWTGIRSAFPPTSVETILYAVPGRFELRQNYPNPFNPSTVLEFRITKRDHVRLKVYDLLGKEIDVLVDNYLDAGSYRAMFDSRNSRGGLLASGIYVARLTAGEMVAHQRLVLLK